MSKRKSFDVFLKDENAVSEEFTSLPALSVVMIGFTLFILLIANTYMAYEQRIDSLEKYQTGYFIATKLTNPDCYFIKEGGIVDIPLLRTDNNTLTLLCEEYKASYVNFILRISWDGGFEDFPEGLSDDLGDRVAVSKNVGIYLNEAQTVPGKLTVIMWNER